MMILVVLRGGWSSVMIALSSRGQKRARLDESRYQNLVTDDCVYVQVAPIFRLPLHFSSSIILDRLVPLRFTFLRSHFHLADGHSSDPCCSYHHLLRSRSSNHPSCTFVDSLDDPRAEIFVESLRHIPTISMVGFAAASATNPKRRSIVVFFCLSVRVPPIKFQHALSRCALCLLLACLCRN